MEENDKEKQEDRTKERLVVNVNERRNWNKNAEEMII